MAWHAQAIHLYCSCTFQGVGGSGAVSAVQVAGATNAGRRLQATQWVDAIPVLDIPGAGQRIAATPGSPQSLQNQYGAAWQVLYMPCLGFKALI